MNGITVKLPDDWHKAIESMNPIKAEYIRNAVAEKLQRDGFIELSEPAQHGGDRTQASANPGAENKE